MAVAVFTGELKWMNRTAGRALVEVWALLLAGVLTVVALDTGIRGNACDRRLPALGLQEIGDRPCPAREAFIANAIRNGKMKKIDRRWPANLAEENATR